MTNVVSEVVRKGKCSGCGVCAGICPANVLSMELQENGDLVPKIINDHCIDKCHQCLDVCPFSQGYHNPRQQNADLFKSFPNAKYDDHIGWHVRSVVGARRNDAMRNASASGGLTTWCLETLLRKHLVTRVAVVRPAQDNRNGFFEFASVSSVDELRQVSGSVYHPVEISGILKEIKPNKEDRWAIVAVPCLASAIRNCRRLRDSVPFVLGLACGMYQNLFYTELLLAESGVDRNAAFGIQYRRKSSTAPPANYRFRGADHRGPGREIPYHSLPFYLGKQAYFRINACNFCMDVFAESADACFMDAWLPPYNADPKGTSLVIIRNPLLDTLFQQGLCDGEIDTTDILAQDATKSQAGQVKRKQHLIYMRLGGNQPENAAQVKSAPIDMLWWQLEQRTQRRSKKAWARYGRTYGKRAFWILMMDVLMLARLIGSIAWLIGIPKRFIRQYRKA